MLLLSLTTAASFSQNLKPRVFSQFPDVIDCPASQFSNVFSAREGDIVTFLFSDNLTISGKVISNLQKYDNLQSMTIQVPSYENAVFHLSKQTNADLTTSFVGRILANSALDGYEINKDAMGKYTLRKVEEENIRQLCNQ